MRDNATLNINVYKNNNNNNNNYCTDLEVTWGNGRGCPLVVHYCVPGWICNRCTGFVAMTTYTSKLIALYTVNAYSTKCEMSASACTHCMACLLIDEGEGISLT